MKVYNFLIPIIILSFSSIHFIEMSSYLSRLSGIVKDKKAIAYSLQNAIFMFTRFFTLLLMPMLGYIIDVSISKDEFLNMAIISVLGAGTVSLIVLVYRDFFVKYFCNVVDNINNGTNILYALIPNKKNINNNVKFNLIINWKIFYICAVIFSIYSLSIYIVFFLSLYFPDYRSTITQLSGVTNAFATVLLTFIVEPKISRTIDQSDSIENSYKMMMSLLYGRVFGVLIISLVVLLLVKLLILL